MMAQQSTMKPGRKRRSAISYAVWLALMALFSAMMFVPLLAMVLTAFKPLPEILEAASFFPRQWNPENFVTAMSMGDWLRYFMNSAAITVMSVAFAMLFNSIAGYAFARLNFAGRDVLFILLLLGLMMPPQVTLLPTFMIIKSFPLVGGNDLFGQGGTGFMNTYAGLVIPMVSGSFGVFLSKQYFMNFPAALDEAAEIDGCGKLRTFFLIYVPISKTLLATLGVLKAVQVWNDYLWPLVITNRDALRTVQLGLTIYRSEFGTDWNLMLAATTLVILPMAVLFLFAQKYFVAGIANTGIKG